MTSRRRAFLRREARREAKGLHGQRNTVKHTVCSECGRYRQVVLPSKLCDRCCKVRS